MAENTGHYFEYLIFKCKYLQAIGSSNHLDIEFNSVTTRHERLEASGNSVKEPEFHKSTRLFLNNSSLLSRRTWRLEIGCWDLKVIEPEVWGLEKVSLQEGCKEGFNSCSITCVLLAPFHRVDCGPLRRVFSLSLSVSPPAVSKEGNNFQGSQFQALRRLQLLLGEPKRVWGDQGFQQGFSAAQMQPAPGIQYAAVLGSSERSSKAVCYSTKLFVFSLSCSI